MQRTRCKEPNLFWLRYKTRHHEHIKANPSRNPNTEVNRILERKETKNYTIIMSTNNKQIQESCKTYFSSEITAWGVIRSGDPSCEQGLLGPAESMDRVETLLAPTDPLWKETPFLAYTYMFKSLCKRFRDKALWSDEVTRSLLMTINCNWHMVVRPKNAMSRRVIALYTSVVATCMVIKKKNRG